MPIQPPSLRHSRTLPPVVSIRYSNFHHTLLDTYIRTVADNLMVYPDQVREKVYAGPYAEFTFIRKQQDKYGSIIDQAKFDYETIRSLYKNVSGLLISKKNPNDPPAYDLSKYLLMKIIKKANVTLVQSNVLTCVSIFNIKKIPSVTFGCLRKDTGLIIFDLFNLKSSSGDINFLGSGTSTTVQKIYIFSLARFAALKISLSNPGNEDIFRTDKRLQQIHLGNSKNICIESRPLLKIKFSINDMIKGLVYRDALITELCAGGDLCTAIENWLIPLNVNPALLIRLGIELIKAVAFLHGLWIIHGDIKPGNCLLTFRLQGGEKVPEKILLSDLGGSKRAGEDMMMNSDMPFCTTFTYLYFTKFDWEQAQALIVAYLTEKDAELKEKLSESWILINVKRDIFALAATLWVLFYGVEPFKLGSAYYPETDYLHLPTNDHMGNEIRDILIAALDENSWQRPSLFEILAVFEEQQVVLQKQKKFFNLNRSI